MIGNGTFGSVKLAARKDSGLLVRQFYSFLTWCECAYTLNRNFSLIFLFLIFIICYRFINFFFFLSFATVNSKNNGFFKSSSHLQAVTKFICKTKVLPESWVKSSKRGNKMVPIELHLLETLSHPNIVQVTLNSLFKTSLLIDFYLILFFYLFIFSFFSGVRCFREWYILSASYGKARMWHGSFRIHWASTKIRWSFNQSHF